MPMDLCKIDDHYVLTADLPGVDPGSVDVDVDSGTLTISAHRTARSEDAVQWLANERFFGTYRRQLSLGEGIDATAISATYENGVLTVTIPLAERAKPRKIESLTAAASSRSSRPPSTPSNRQSRLRADRDSAEQRSVRSPHAARVTRAVQPVQQVVAHRTAIRCPGSSRRRCRAATRRAAPGDCAASRRASRPAVRSPRGW